MFYVIIPHVYTFIKVASLAAKNISEIHKEHGNEKVKNSRETDIRLLTSAYYYNCDERIFTF